MCKLTKHLFHIENWYYSKCKDFVILKDQYQRTCLICGNSLANYIYLPLENQLLKLVKKFPNVSLMGCLINHTQGRIVESWRSLIQRHRQRNFFFEKRFKIVFLHILIICC